MKPGGLAAGLLFGLMGALLVTVIVTSLPRPPRPEADAAAPPAVRRAMDAGEARAAETPPPKAWHGLSLREARYYERKPGGRVVCTLCPWRCDLGHEQQGRCGARVNLNGTLYTLVYGKPVAMAVDPVEKKPVYHFLPGETAFSIATAGCNLGCIFCQNWQISQALPQRARYREVSPEQVVALAERYGCKTIAYTYTEPVIFYEYMFDTARLAHQRGIRNIMVTCGYLNPEPVRELCKVMDAANVDLKGYSEAFYRDYCGATLQPVLETIKILKQEGVWVELTNLIIPGANDDSEMIRRMCRWIKKNVGDEVPLHFNAFHPAYKLLDRPRTPLATLLRARRIALEEGLKYVYVGNVRAPGGGTTRCPKCGRELVRREGFAVVRNIIKNGRCPSCGYPVAGVWSAKEPPHR